MNNLAANLKKLWIEQDLNITTLNRRLRYGAIYWRALSMISVVAAIAAVGAGSWFAMKAVRQRDLLYALSAFALLVAVPPAAVAEVRARGQGMKWHDQTPEGTIRYALRRTVITERLLRITFFNGCVLSALVTAVWICVLLGLIPKQSCIVTITGIWLGVAMGTLLWVRFKKNSNQRERERCEKLLVEYTKAAE